jgi:hypothetical protein
MAFLSWFGGFSAAMMYMYGLRSFKFGGIKIEQKYISKQHSAWPTMESKKHPRPGGVANTRAMVRRRQEEITYHSVPCPGCEKDLLVSKLVPPGTTLKCSSCMKLFARPRQKAPRMMARSFERRRNNIPGYVRSTCPDCCLSSDVPKGHSAGVTVKCGHCMAGPDQRRPSLSTVGEVDAKSEEPEPELPEEPEPELPKTPVLITSGQLFVKIVCPKAGCGAMVGSVTMAEGLEPYYETACKRCKEPYKIETRRLVIDAKRAAGLLRVPPRRAQRLNRA